jgi:hypothetical protein
VTKAKKTMGVQQILLSPKKEVKALLEYLCQQSGKLYNSGVYLARQTFFKTGKLLTGKFDLSFESSIVKSMVAKSLPSTPMQQTLMSVTKDRLKQLCDLSGIRFTETEEAYTSKASFLDADSGPKYGEKPSGWKASGKRIKRGLYRSLDGTVVNADLNGSANILRKVVSKLGVSLDRLNRRCLTTVARVRLWVLSKSALSAESQCL